MSENIKIICNEAEAFLNEIPNIHIKPPATTFGTIFKHEHKENFISDWLAYLLDSNNTGTTEPLETLLDIALEEKPDIDFSEITVQREYVFPKTKRRIDFLITTPSHIIGMENKIWSGLQDKQLEDYSKQIKDIRADIKKEYQEDSSEPENEKYTESNTILILLCPDSNPVKKEISNNFKLVTYDKLIERFKNIRLNCLQNLRASIMMEDFITHVEAFFMKVDNNDFDFDFIKFQNDNLNRIKQFNDNIESSKKQFIKQFELAIINNGFGDNWTVLPKGGKNYFMQIYKPYWNNGQTHFEFLTDDNYPPKIIKVTFHVEGGKLPHNDELSALGKNDTIAVAMDYKSNESFKSSVKQVVLALKEMDKRYTNKIDRIFIDK